MSSGESNIPEREQTVDLTHRDQKTAEETPTHDSLKHSHLDETFARAPAEGQGAASQPPASAASVPSGSTAGRDVPTAFGRYKVRRQLGEGGFGAVYLAYDDELDREVAVKVARSRSTSQQIEEFRLEARRVAQLKHPGIVSVYDLGVDEGQCYIVCDFLSGVDLDKWLGQIEPTWQESVKIVADIADALAHAHEHSIVHRDIKANNVILVQGKPVLVDFGLAIGESDDKSIQRGLVSGTPHYMSPEQTGGRAHRIDGRTDIYSLGVILYRMLCGRFPFRAKEIKELFREIREDLPQPIRQTKPNVPPDVEGICKRAMAKNIDDRYSTASDMADDLRRALGIMSSQSFHGSAAPVVSDTQVLPVATSPPVETRELPSVLRKAREAERRQLTVMYCGCDLRDANEDLESLDPEEQHDLVVAFQKACEEVTGRFDGTTIPTSDDKQLICFGYPIGYEDAAQRAVRTGFALLDELAKLNERHKKQKKQLLDAWIVIHTGQVVVGDTTETGGGEGISLVGEGRNIATKMENAAVGGKVIVSNSTFKIIKRVFKCDSLGSVKIKGLSAPLEVYEVIAEIENAGQASGVEQARMTPLVGRDREVELLRDRWEDAAEGIGQVVLLVGDAGLGKSRLVQVVREHAIGESGDDDKTPIVEWRCTSYFQNTSLYAPRHYFEHTLDFGRDDSAAEKLAKLESFLDDYELGAKDEVVPLFASMLSIPCEDRFPPLELTPQRQKERTLEVLVDWLRAHATRQPILFIVEDLQWVDPSTLEALTMLVEQSSREQMLVLFTFRPEFEVPWGHPAHQTQVPLNRLRKKQIVEMMQLKTGLSDIPPHIVEQIVDRTDGVPLFIEEFTTMLQDTGGLKEVDGSVTMTSSFSLDAIPATLQDLLMSRLDRMEADREVVQLAATLGREFTFELIQGVSDSDENTLLEELAMLVGAEVLIQRGRPPKCTYQFKQALIQDAAYQSLLKKKRLQFHQKTAEVLEQQFPELVESAPELLAHHFTEADEIERGIAYWLKAGQRSQARSANAEAIHQLGRGLELVATLDESTGRDQMELGLLVPRGVVYMATMGWGSEEVGQTFRRATEICQKLGARDHQFNVMWGMWAWHLLRGEFDTCLELAAVTTKLAEELQHPAILMEAPWIQACTQFYRGNFKDAVENCQLGFSRWDEETSKLTALATGQNCGVTYQLYIGIGRWYLGFPDQALEHVNKAVELAVQLKHPFSHDFALWHKSWLLTLRRDGKDAQSIAEKSFKLGVDQSFPLWKFLSLVTQGHGLWLQGKYDQALEPITQGVGAIGFMGSRLNFPHVYNVLALAQWKLSKFDEALQSLDVELDHARKSNELFTLAEIHRLRGEILLDQSAGNAAQAEQCFHEALQVARGQAAKSWELRAATSLARLCRSQGKTAEARGLLEPVYNWFTEGFATQDLIDAKQLIEQL